MPLFGRRRDKGQEKAEPQPERRESVQANASLPEAPARPAGQKRALPVVANPGGAAPRPVQVPGGAPGTPRPLPMASGGGPRPLPVMPARPASAPERTIGMEKPAASPLEEAVRRAVATIHDPEIGRPMVELGMIKELTVTDRVVTIGVELTTPACPLKERIQEDVRATILAAAPEVERIDINLTARVRAANTM